MLATIPSASSRPRIEILLLVSVLLIVPALVRASERLGGSYPSPIRLSRGFELPPTKCNIAPPAEITVPCESAVAPAPSPLTHHAVPRDETIPPASTDSSPDPQRGPPRLTLA